VSGPASPAASRAPTPWYKDGVRFTCQSGCTRCCGGAPGDVFVTAEEILAIAGLMKMDVKEFEDSYVRHYSSGKMSLIERRNGDCILLEPGKGCTVYEARPKQCRDYPFWPEVMKSPFAWIREAQRCPGIDVGETHSAVTIAELLASQKED